MRRKGWAIVLDAIDSSIDEPITLKLSQSSEDNLIAAMNAKNAVYRKTTGKTPPQYPRSYERR
jgi:hypothetical protein